MAWNRKRWITGWLAAVAVWCVAAAPAWGAVSSDAEGNLYINGDVEETTTGTPAAVANGGTSAAPEVIVRSGVTVEQTDTGTALQVTNADYRVEVGGGSTVAGETDGIETGPTVTARITNSGTVRGTDGAGVNLGAGGTITNNGTITGNHGVAAIAGTVTLVNDGTVTGTDDAGSAVIIANGTVTNRGTIGGSGIGLALDGSVENAGVIYGGNNAALSLGTGAGTNSTLVNTGEIRAEGSATTAIETGAGDDTLLFRGGSVITGDLQDNGGTDRIILEGSSSYDGTIAGYETLTRRGSGYWKLSGTSTFGRVEVISGELQVDGNLAGDVTIYETAAFGGQGTVTGDLVNHGKFYPFVAGKNMTIQGSFTQSDTGDLRVALYADGRSDKLEIQGTADIQGGKITPRTQRKDYPAETKYEVVNATGGLQGTFDEVVETSPILDFSIEYQPDRVYITATRHYFVTEAVTKNQIALANTIDQIVFFADGDFYHTLLELKRLRGQERRDAYDQMMPKVHLGMATVSQGAANATLGTLAQRMSDWRMGLHFAGTAGAGKNYIDNLLGGAPVDPELMSRALDADGTPRAVANVPAADRVGADWQFWVKPVGTIGDRESESGHLGFDYTTTGVVVGGDKLMRDKVLAGLVLGGDLFEVDWDDAGGSDADGYSYYLGGYTSYFDADWHVDGSITYGCHRYEKNRRIVFGNVDRTAEGIHGADQWTFAANAGRFFRTRGFVIEPHGGIQYSILTEEDFNEEGADSLNLRIPARDTDSLQTVVGVKATRPTRFEKSKAVVIPEVRAKLAYEWLDDPSEIEAHFIDTAATEPSFSIKGPEVPALRGLVGLGVTIIPTENLSLFAHYDAEIASDLFVHTVQAGFRWEF